MREYIQGSCGEPSFTPHTTSHYYEVGGYYTTLSYASLNDLSYYKVESPIEESIKAAPRQLGQLGRNWRQFGTLDYDTGLFPNMLRMDHLKHFSKIMNHI